MSAHQLVVILLLSAVFLAKSNAAGIPKYAEYFQEEIPNDTAKEAKDASLSYPPSCTPFYPGMVSPRGFTNVFPTPYGVCASLYTGRFVAVSIAILPHFNIYSESGLIVKTVPYPAPNGAKTDCVFTRDYIFITDITFDKILQYTADGTFIRDFAIGQKFLRMTYGGDTLYATVLATHKIFAFNITTRDELLRFESTSPTLIRGITMDKHRNLHVTSLSKVVETFTFDGHKIGERSYPELIAADGIEVDDSDNLIIADHASKVVIYNPAGTLIKKFFPLPLPVDTAISYDCSFLYIAAYSMPKVYIY